MARKFSRSSAPRRARSSWRATPARTHGLCAARFATLGRSCTWSAIRLPARSMPAAAMNGSGRRCGNPPISARHGRIPAKASPIRRARRRSKRSGPWRRATASFMRAWSRRGCSSARTKARAGSMCGASASIPRASNWQAGGIGLVLHSIIPHRDRRPEHVGRHFRRSACSRPPMAARAGRRATRARAAISCPRSSAIPNSASACIASCRRRACPTGSISRTIAACIAATMAARAGSASRRGCPRPSASRPSPIRVTPTRSISCRSTATSRAAMCRTARPQCGAPAMAARRWEALREGLPQHNAFLGVLRQAMATDRLEPAGIYFGT